MKKKSKDVPRKLRVMRIRRLKNQLEPRILEWEAWERETECEPLIRLGQAWRKLLRIFQETPRSSRRIPHFSVPQSNQNIAQIVKCTAELLLSEKTVKDAVAHSAFYHRCIQKFGEQKYPDNVLAAGGWQWCANLFYAALKLSVSRR